MDIKYYTSVCVLTTSPKTNFVVIYNTNIVAARTSGVGNYN